MSDVTSVFIQLKCLKSRPCKAYQRCTYHPFKAIHHTKQVSYHMMTLLQILHHVKYRDSLLVRIFLEHYQCIVLDHINQTQSILL